MERKFLVFSCLVLLISIVYFFYTSYQLDIENRNHREATAESEEPFVGSVSTIGRVSTSSYSQSSKLEHLHPEPTVEEWNAFEEALKSTEVGKTESMADTGDFDEMKTKASKEQISPELGAVFIALKQRYDQRRVICHESAPFSKELGELKYRQIEIIMYDLVGASGEETKRLYEEFHRSQDRMQGLRTIIAPLDEQRLQLEKEVEQVLFEYGMTVEEFYEIYDELYESWESG